MYVLKVYTPEGEVHTYTEAALITAKEGVLAIYKDTEQSWSAAYAPGFWKRFEICFLENI